MAPAGETEKCKVTPVLSCSTVEVEGRYEVKMQRSLLCAKSAPCSCSLMRLADVSLLRAFGRNIRRDGISQVAGTSAPRPRPSPGSRRISARKVLLFYIPPKRLDSCFHFVTMAAPRDHLKISRWGRAGAKHWPS